jgi:hypothetical protein
MVPILIEINKGIAEVVAPKNRHSVEIIDVDLLRSGAYEDAERYWNECLSARARRYITARYPQIAGPLSHSV